jgi:hypothetical protein
LKNLIVPMIGLSKAGLTIFDQNTKQHCKPPFALLLSTTRTPLKLFLNSL